MTSKIYHGEIKPADFAQALIAEFNHGNLEAQQIGSGDEIVVQIATSKMRSSGGNTAISVSLKRVSDGVSVELGRQSWFGVAASLGVSALAALRNPFSLITRLDDIAQDIESIQLTEKIWETIEQVSQSFKASLELSERLRRVICEYCNTPNPVGQANCIACGAPLGNSQPITCPNCGYVLKANETICPNCGYRL